MKTLIVFDSKHGTVKDCATKVGDKLNGEVSLVQVQNKKQWPSLDEYDQVIIGGSIHAGKLQKSITEFCQVNLDKLLQKKVGIFLCTLTPVAEAFHYIEELFPPKLVEHAAAKSCFGGAMYYERMNFVERFIMKKITKSSVNLYQVSDDTIEDFAAVCLTD